MPKVIDETGVFEAAVAMFVSEGYDGTTTRAIASAAGVNEVTLFRRYGTKAKLMKAAIDHQWRYVPLASLAYSGDVEADLVSIVDAYLETNRLRGGIVPVLLVELARNDELRGAFHHAAHNIGHIAEIVARHQDAGRLRPEDPMVAVTALVAPLMANEMFHRASIGLGPAEIDVEAYVQAYLYGRSTDRAQQG